MTQPQPTLSLRELGWGPFFARQPTAEEREAGFLPGRVFEVQRKRLTVVLEGTSVELPFGGRWFQLEPTERPTLGDWLLLDPDATAIRRLLERRSLLMRVPPGREREVQLIAANVDTVFLVTSCNEEFNASRLERYLALAYEAGTEPVVVLTKADQASDPDAFVAAVRALKRDLAVELVDARDPTTLDGVRAWCRTGQTVALLGSSGVGKSTLVNSLSGSRVQLTREAREADAKGRHTTTQRSIHVLPDGGLLVDNPGMRELALVGGEQAAAELFEDVEALAARCRFRDCRHEAEPGCAVQAAVAAGTLDPRRLESYRKLLREDAQRTETLGESRARSRAQSRRIRQILSEKHKHKR